MEMKISETFQLRRILKILVKEIPIVIKNYLRDLIPNKAYSKLEEFFYKSQRILWDIEKGSVE